MKKLILILIAAVLMTACAKKPNTVSGNNTPVTTNTTARLWLNISVNGGDLDTVNSYIKLHGVTYSPMQFERKWDNFANNKLQDTCFVQVGDVVQFQVFSGGHAGVPQDIAYDYSVVDLNNGNFHNYSGPGSNLSAVTEAPGVLHTFTVK